MIHSSWPWVAPRSRARSCWATLSPDTEATTAISAAHMAMRMRRCRRGSVTTAPPPSCARGVRVSTWCSVRRRSVSSPVRNGIVLFHVPAVTRPGVRQPSPVPCSTVDPRVSRSRAAVIRAATDLLVEGGPNAVTVDSIVARSGVAKSTIYRHWESRDDILVSVIESCAPHIPEPAPDPDVVDALRQVVHSMAESLNDPEWARVLPALLMLKNHEAGIAAMNDRLEHEQDMVVTT